MGIVTFVYKRIKTVLGFLMSVCLMASGQTVYCDSARIETDSVVAGRSMDVNVVSTNTYALPYSFSKQQCAPDWKRLWQNTAVLGGAYVGTLLVLECLPEDATSWNRAELRDVPLFTRWKNHVIKKGPEWDHDKFYFNYILHPYAGAVYFMGARSCGFNAWQSLLYCTCVSTVGWEFGIEAFMERPSYQDLIITPLVGSAIGECFYRIKRGIVDDGYTLGGSKVLGNIVVFLIDPIIEVIDLFRGSETRNLEKKDKYIESMVVPSVNSRGASITLAVTF